MIEKSEYSKGEYMLLGRKEEKARLRYNLPMQWCIVMFTDRDKDKDKDNDKDKVSKRPSMCYIFEKQKVQGYQI